MKSVAGILLIALAFVAYRSLLRRTQRAAGVDPDALISVVQRRAWLQWYLVILMLIIAALVYATTSGAIEMNDTRKIVILVGGVVLFAAPIFIAGRHD